MCNFTASFDFLGAFGLRARCSGVLPTDVLACTSAPVSRNTRRTLWQLPKISCVQNCIAGLVRNPAVRVPYFAGEKDVDPLMPCQQRHDERSVSLISTHFRISSPFEEKPNHSKMSRDIKAMLRSLNIQCSHPLSIESACRPGSCDSFLQLC